jgi:hypothetical protein
MTRSAGNYRKRAAAARLHNELRPIHFIKPRSFTSAIISLQVSNHYKIVMFGKLNFSGRSLPAVELLALRSQPSLVLRAKFAAELLRHSECLLASVNVKFQSYCETGIGFAMTKVDMDCGA